MQHEVILHYRKFWLSLGWLLVVSVWYLSLMSKPPQVDLGLDFFDKISHFTAYTVMMGWFMQLYPSKRTQVFYALGFISMGITIEFLQGMGTARLFEYADMAANTLGVMFAWLIVRGRLQQSLARFEKMFLHS